MIRNDTDVHEQWIIYNFIKFFQNLCELNMFFVFFVKMPQNIKYDPCVYNYLQTKAKLKNQIQLPFCLLPCNQKE